MHALNEAAAMMSATIHLRDDSYAGVQGWLGVVEPGHDARANRGGGADPGSDLVGSRKDSGGPAIDSMFASPESQHAQHALTELSQHAMQDMASEQQGMAQIANVLSSSPEFTQELTQQVVWLADLLRERREAQEADGSKTRSRAKPASSDASSPEHHQAQLAEDLTRSFSSMLPGGMQDKFKAYIDASMQVMVEAERMGIPLTGDMMKDAVAILEAVQESPGAGRKPRSRSRSQGRGSSSKDLRPSASSKGEHGQGDESDSFDDDSSGTDAQVPAAGQDSLQPPIGAWRRRRASHAGVMTGLGYGTSDQRERSSGAGAERANVSSGDSDEDWLLDRSLGLDSPVSLSKAQGQEARADAGLAPDIDIHAAASSASAPSSPSQANSDFLDDEGWMDGVKGLASVHGKINTGGLRVDLGSPSDVSCASDPSSSASTGLGAHRGSTRGSDDVDHDTFAFIRNCYRSRRETHRKAKPGSLVDSLRARRQKIARAAAE